MPPSPSARHTVTASLAATPEEPDHITLLKKSLLFSQNSLAKGLSWGLRRGHTSQNRA